MAADRNYRRRLATLLGDEDYGPKLARLRGADEQRALQLIHDNRGKEARAHILAADERRRETVRASRRRLLERRAVDNQMDVHRQGGLHPVRSTLESGARMLSDADLRFAATASRVELVARARRPPDRFTPRGEDWNPFWYH